MYLVENLVKELAKHGHFIQPDAYPSGIVKKHNYLTDEAMVEVAKELDISAAEVYGQLHFIPSSIQQQEVNML